MHQQALQAAWQHFQAGRLQEAGLIYQRILQTEPRNAEVWHLLGGVASKLGKFQAAIELIEKAIALKPDISQYHNNLGYLFQTLRQPAKALACYDRALTLQPGYPDAHLNRANAFRAQGRLEEAINDYRKVLALKPDFIAAHHNLLFTLICAGHEPAEILQEHLAFQQLHAEPLARSLPPHGNTPEPERKLRVGYVSADFKIHSVAYFIEPVLQHHDPERFEVYAYYNHRRHDAVTQRLRGYCRQWRDIVGMSDEQVADRIRSDGIDILVDLGGHTADNRLLVFARKPAPVQVSWIGYPATTGLTALDYRLTDGLADPVGQAEAFHTEQLVRLPECFSCYRPPEPCPEVTPLPARVNGRVTFGSFNNFAKITPQVLALWAQILRAVPGSRLLLKACGLGEAEMQGRVHAVFAAAGVEAGRVVLFGNDPTIEDHLQRYGQVDIGLDPFPYNGTTTTCEALWMGVPVITLAGQAHAGRVGVSLLSNVGLAEFIAADPQDYVGIAVRLAGDHERLEALRAGMRARLRASPLLDAPRLTRHLEAAYREMWGRWCQSNHQNRKEIQGEPGY